MIQMRTYTWPVNNARSGDDVTGHARKYEGSGAMGGCDSGGVEMSDSARVLKDKRARESADRPLSNA